MRQNEDDDRSEKKECKRTRKKNAEHKQNLLIYFVCKAFDSRDLLSVKAPKQIGNCVYTHTFAKKLCVKGTQSMRKICGTQYCYIYK